MPFGGLFNFLFGHQDDGIQQVSHSPNSDSMMFQNQQGQQHQMSGQQLQSLAAQQQQQASMSQQMAAANSYSFGIASDPGLIISRASFEAYQQAFAGSLYPSQMYQGIVSYDLSWETTKKSCDIIHKAIENLSLLRRLK